MDRVGTGGSTLEYIGEARTAQLQDKKIGKMGQVPLPNEKSELLNCSGQGYNAASSSCGPCTEHGPLISAFGFDFANEGTKDVP